MVSLSVVILHLIRHGASAPDPAAPAQDWPLASFASEGVVELRDSGALPVRARWFSSPEPKAIDTARLLHSGEVQVVDDLREADRSAVWFDDAAEFGAVVERAFSTPDTMVVDGWEPLAFTRARVSNAARGLLTMADNGVDVVMVGHGTAWTLLIAELTSSDLDVVSWRSMAMPDHCALDVRAGQVISAWGEWRSE